MSDYGLIGEKLGHSFSTFLHWEFKNPEYELMEIPRDSVDEYLTKAEFKGINVTIPYKETAIKYCIPDETAVKIGCVNTLVRKDSGDGDKPLVYGYNTDCLGFKYMLDREGISLSAKNIVILGTGGTSKTAGYVCASEGASSITVVSRKKFSPESDVNGDTENDAKERNVAKSGTKIEYITYDELNSGRCKNAEVLINTTPVGMYPNNYACPVDISIFDKLEGVVDVIYNPLVTALVYEAKRRGIKATCGLPMLVAQAYYAEQLFFDGEIHTEDSKGLKNSEIERVIENVSKEKQNIVLVGMPGCGKSTQGRLLSCRFDRDYIDTDVVFKEKTGISAGDYITQYGEQAFRDEETLVVKDVAKNSGVIIATGGGSILRPENVDALKMNGKIIYLYRPKEQLSVKNRPLSQNGRLDELYKVRCPIYESIADVKISVKKTPEETLEEILKIYENTCD